MNEISDTATKDDFPEEAAQSGDRSLTLKPRRLMGSALCLNCRTELKGPYCYYCGQPDRNLLRFFPALMREFLEDFLELDTRFSRTLLPLLFIPGKLTRDYLDGRRFRYTPPLRIYIFASMAFFLLTSLLAGNAIHIYGTDNPDTANDSGIHISYSSEKDLDDQLDSLGETLSQTDPALGDQVAKQVKQAVEDAEKVQGGESSGLVTTQSTEEELTEAIEQINLNGKPWHRETNPVIIPEIPGFINDWINNEIEESPQKGKEIEENPNIIIDKIFEVLPFAMFILLPAVALLFKFWYLFAKRYYMEHLIHAFHNHSFLFVVLMINLVGDSVAGWQEPGGEGLWSTAMAWLNIAIMLWIPIYLFLSLKRVYQQGWTLTVVKFGVIGISYVLLLLVVAAFTALLGFVLL